MVGCWVAVAAVVVVGGHTKSEELDTVSIAVYSSRYLNWRCHLCYWYYWKTGLEGGLNWRQYQDEMGKDFDMVPEDDEVGLEELEGLADLVEEGDSAGVVGGDEDVVALMMMWCCIDEGKRNTLLIGGGKEKNSKKKKKVVVVGRRKKRKKKKKSAL